jgi:DNA-3-methyladenine glycosylase
MARARGRTDARSWCSGPGKLAQALGIDEGDDGADLLARGPLRLAPGISIPQDAIETAVRVGVASGIETPWRFAVRDSPWLSRPLSRPSASRR